MLPSPGLDLFYLYLLGLIGLIVGGLISYFVNLFLLNEGWLSYPSAVSGCCHKGDLREAIPLLSFFLLSDRCKYCQSRLTWQVPFTEVLTCFIFLFIAGHFGLGLYAYGMMIFTAVLIAICITDFKAKIIPHEITYPAIIAGIIFSIIIKANILGVLAGIGISYMLFDFLAFYGLKFYLWWNKPTLEAPQQFTSMEIQPVFVSGKKSVQSEVTGGARKASVWLSKEAQLSRSLTEKRGGTTARLYCKGIPVDELEILGGGDAVLSALIASWLGWQKLIVAVAAGFLVGTVMGAIYVLFELWKGRLLRTAIVPVVSCVLGLSSLMLFMLWGLSMSVKQPLLNMPFLYALPWAVLAGCLLGVIIAGSKISKPFPFGPALAIGAIIAVFRNVT